MAHMTQFKHGKEIEIKNTNLDILQLIEQLRGRRFATVQEIAHTLVKLEIW